MNQKHTNMEPVVASQDTKEERALKSAVMRFIRLSDNKQSLVLRTHGLMKYKNMTAESISAKYGVQKSVVDGAVEFIEKVKETGIFDSVMIDWLVAREMRSLGVKIK